MKLWKVTLADRSGEEHPIDYRWFDAKLSRAAVYGTLVFEGHHPNIKIVEDHSLEHINGHTRNSQASVC